MKSTIRTQGLALLLCALGSCLGFFLRLNQLRLERHADGTVTWGGPYSVALLILCGLFLLALICLLLPLDRRPNDSSVFSARPLPNALLLLGALGLLVGNVLNWSSGVAGTLPALLGMAAAVCAAVFAVFRLGQKTPSPLLYMCVSLYLALHLILSFKNWNSDPAVQDYCYTLLAILCAMLAVFQTAGFCFDAHAPVGPLPPEQFQPTVEQTSEIKDHRRGGKRRVTLFWLFSALIFCAVSLADGVDSGDAAALCISGGLFLTVAVHGVALLLAQPPAETAD